jgi:1,4-alpha-glucan branching enzyme
MSNNTYPIENPDRSDNKPGESDPVPKGMGAIPYECGVAFRVWAPNAKQVAVAGSFNGWQKGRHELRRDGNGYWCGNVPEAREGDEYRFIVNTDKGELWRNDPYARQLTATKSNGVVFDPRTSAERAPFHLSPWNELAIYEMHIGTFNRKAGSASTGTFDSAIERFEHLSELGVNAIEVMPITGFPGERSWGYNPTQAFAVESSYGGPKAFQRFIREAHRRGIAVILDVVYNHLGPGGLDLWQFDGWNENNLGGIYFYNDWRAATPWGHTRPDYGRPAVRDFFRDNALMWLDEYNVDGLRFDATAAMRACVPDTSAVLPDGVSLLQWLNHEIRRRHPDRITIAEDLQDSAWLTSPSGMNFGSQWDAQFVNLVRRVVSNPSDDDRSLPLLCDALTHRYNGDAFQRVIYLESHDDVASGKQRVPVEIHAHDPHGWFAQKRSTLAAGLLCTSPGIPMLFQGQEFLDERPFHDGTPMNWERQDRFAGIVSLYRDLVGLRLNRTNKTRGLCGQHINIHHRNEGDKVLAFHRWDRGGPGDDVVVVANLRNRQQRNYRLGFPAPGAWKLLLNTDWRGYSNIFGDTPSSDVVARAGAYDSLAAHADISIGPYSLLVFAREPR